MQNSQKMCDFNYYHHYHYHQYNHPITLTQTIENSNIGYPNNQGYNNNLQSSFNFMTPPSSESPPLNNVPTLTEIYHSFNKNCQTNSCNQQFQSSQYQNYFNQNFVRYDNLPVDQNNNNSFTNNNTSDSGPTYFNCQYGDHFYNFVYDPKCGIYMQEDQNSINSNQFQSFNNLNKPLVLPTQLTTLETQAPAALDDVELKDIKPCVKEEKCISYDDKMRATIKHKDNEFIKLKVKKSNKKYKDFYEPTIDLSQPNVTTIMQRPVDMGETKRYKRRNTHDIEKRRIFACKYEGRTKLLLS